LFEETGELVELDDDGDERGDNAFEVWEKVGLNRPFLVMPN